MTIIDDSRLHEYRNDVDVPYNGQNNLYIHQNSHWFSKS